MKFYYNQYNEVPGVDLGTNVKSFMHTVSNIYLSTTDDDSV